MAAESQRSIEKWLKSYAQKREKAAGPPFAMPLATRQVLQAEVARTYLKLPSNAWSVRQILLRFWPQFACGAAFLGLLVLLATQWRQVAPPLPEPIQLAKSGENSTFHSPALTATPGSGITAGGTSDRERVPQPDKSMARDSVQPYGLKRVDAQRSSEKLVLDQSMETIPLPATQPSAPPIPASGFSMAGTRNAGNVLSPSQRGLEPGSLLASRGMETPPAPTAAESGSGRSVAASRPAGLPVAAPAPMPMLARQTSFAPTNRFYFSQTPAPTSRQRNLNSSKAPKILNSFTMEQSGNQVRLLDEDGSIYLGEMQTMASSNAPALGVSMRAKKAEEKMNQPLASYSATAPGRSNPESSQPSLRQSSFNIRAEGTNRSMNQSVVFRGNCESGILQGQVLIGGTNLLDINAVQRGTP